MKRSEIFFGALRLPVDYLAILAAFLFAYYIRPITDLIPGVQYEFQPELLPPFEGYFLFALVASAALIILFGASGLYSFKGTKSFGKRLFKILFLISAWVMFIIAYYFLIVHELFFSRIALAHIWLFTIFFTILGRFLVYLIQQSLLRFGIGRRRLLFVGVSPLADRYFDLLKKDARYEIIGALADNQFSREKNKLKVIGLLENLDSIVKKYKVDEIVQTDQRMKEMGATEVLEYCRVHQIKYQLIPSAARLQRMNVEMEMVGDIPVMNFKQTSLGGWGHIYKRLFDFFFSLFLIILLIPVWIIVPLLIKFESKGPIIYKSKRKYRNKIFHIYKFRSMIPDADEVKKKLMEKNERKGPLFKIKEDPRITKFGRFLRKTSIDELPQLFNVLFGHVSLVGPRPHLPEEVDQYERHHLQVFAIKPGVTGLAQVSGRSNLDFEEEVKLDIYYIENWSPWLDIKIILKSILVVLKADGC